ncbi:MAG: hypothetical protein KF718_07460 [Polyangiaceae bacterium]|nr:hypothetical protein [Polyangiaceae bacterium]
MRTTIRLIVAALFVGLTSTALAAAAPGQQGERREARDGKGKGKGQWFAKLDANKDGFLTRAEVGERRWNRIQVADANKDNKVSKAELQKAKADGKLGKGKGKGKKAKDAAQARGKARS